MLKNAFLKYILVCFFILAILEKTGVSVLSLMANGKHLTEALMDDQQDDDARTANESKESVKEYWLFENSLDMPEPYLYCQPLTYADNVANNPLAYFPSVPTPPPNPAV
ncbi:hypothetical protein EOD41_04490 [Mucilaginibacter limnophilus]|uniref:Uncharacterized protein n=1 Tax=Mucilaginibacter limnophilus TaxID=1932778 RepID=A0A3S2VN22_9SPHI|nr:hypothetical protein [Mucilaginibacter limnophilus]RVU01230.1 hypothetical protein EOD41_04490 [Mucilaginibacter limnophilus]